MCHDVTEIPDVAFVRTTVTAHCRFDSSLTNRPSPVRVLFNLPFASVTVGGLHSCGLTDDDLAYCWGRATSGQLGIGRSLPLTGIAPPTLVSGQLSM